MSLWLPDPDPDTAALEAALSALGTFYLYGLHRSLHEALALPKLPAAAVREAYRTRTLPRLTGTSPAPSGANRSVATRNFVLTGTSPAPSGANRTVAPLAKAPGPSRHEAWSKALAYFQRVRSLGLPVPPTAYRDLVDAATERWYAVGWLETRARRRAVASFLLGELKAGRALEPAEVLTRLHGFGDRVAEARARYAAERAAEHVQHLHAKARHALLGTLYAAEEDRTPPEQLAQTLLAQFATQNRDWRRVAVTETAINRANGFVAALPPGSRVRWSSARDCCPKCSALDQRTFTVVAPDKPDKDPLTEVWTGKTTRGHDPLQHPAIPLHPNCRCAWAAVLAGDRPAGVDPGIAARVRQLIAAAQRL